jgi:hypothetical protein
VRANLLKSFGFVKYRSQKGLRQAFSANKAERLVDGTAPLATTLCHQGRNNQEKRKNGHCLAPPRGLSS